jgi:hypothetical protein
MKMSTAWRSTRRLDSSMDAPRAFLNEMVWFMRHSQGLHLTGLDVEAFWGKATGLVMVGMGMASGSLDPTRERVP